jgi:hypothetical protein
MSPWQRANRHHRETKMRRDDLPSQPGTRGCLENFDLKTKTAQPFSGAAPFSAIK